MTKTATTTSRTLKAHAMNIAVGAARTARTASTTSPSSRSSSEPVTGSTKSGTATGSRTASQQIDQRIADLDDWRGELLAQLRAIVKEVAPDIIEEWKWRGVPVWSLDGIVCTGETYKSIVKMTFAKGAALSDPSGLFNSSLEGNTRRAIDFPQGAKINVKALKALLRDAVLLNRKAKS